MRDVNGAGFDPRVEDVPNNLYEEDTTNINDELLCESESVVQGRYDYLSHEDGGRVESPLSTSHNT